MGPAGYAATWPALQSASARFAAAHALRPFKGGFVLADQASYAAIVGSHGPVLHRDDGPEHTPAAASGLSCEDDTAEERVMPHGNPDEPGTSGQDSED